MPFSSRISRALALVALRAAVTRALPSSQAASVDVLPAGWTAQGCFTDIASARTLGQNTFSNPDSMTPGFCATFCNSHGFIFAGVEFGDECWCDYAIQNPGALAANATDCNVPCTGDATLNCGGGNRINVLRSNATGPVIKDPVATWHYNGCFSDDGRLLLRRFDIAAGVTAESCTAQCKAAGFGIAGLEFSGECWCENLLQVATKTNDTNCHLTCAGDATHSEFCGGASHASLYIDSAAAQLSPTACIEPRFDFSLVARAKTATTGGVAIQGLNVLTAGNNTFSILSSCTTCTGEQTFSVTAAEMLFTTGTNPAHALALRTGESAAFVSTAPKTPSTAFQYCANAFGTVAAGTAPTTTILSGNGHSDLWALCANTTAAGRQDLVWSPIVGHAHYNATLCQAVNLLITFKP